MGRVKITMKNVSLFFMKFIHFSLINTPQIVAILWLIFKVLKMLILTYFCQKSHNLTAFMCVCGGAGFVEVLVPADVTTVNLILITISVFPFYLTFT